MSTHRSLLRLPYFPVSDFYKTTFGEKVWKVSVSTASTCPNREGIRGMKVCNFCDEWGSAAYPEFRKSHLREQISTIKEKLKQRYKANKFLVYFQSYTNTFAKTQVLRQQFECALEFEDVVGIVVGTRPDCISDAVLELWREYEKKTFVAVELGVQSFFEEDLLWMRRGHTAQKSIESTLKIRNECPNVNLGIHLMFGLPHETRQRIVEQALICNQLPIDNVKLHNLHVLKNTPLEVEYKSGKFHVIDREEYAQRVIQFLQFLSPEVAVHRLTAVASRHDELVAPKWAGNKMASYQFVLDQFAAQKAYQGQNFNSKNWDATLVP